MKLLPFFRRMEADLDIRDDFHGNDGPMRVRRHKEEAWEPLMFAFRDACVSEGYPDGQDMNNPDSTGVAPLPMNNVGGVRLSTALSLHQSGAPPAEPDHPSQRAHHPRPLRRQPGRWRPSGERRRDLHGGGGFDRSVHRLDRLTAPVDGVRRRAPGPPVQYGSAGGARPAGPWAKTTATIPRSA